MRKGAIILICIILLMTMTSCMPGRAASTASKPDIKNSELKALCEYLVQEGHISEEAIKTEESFIDADEGYRYSSSKFGNIEIYYFSSTESDKYKEAQSGEIDLFGTKYKTAFSSDGKFLMVYSKDVDLTELEKDKSSLLNVFKKYPNKKAKSE